MIFPSYVSGWNLNGIGGSGNNVYSGVCYSKQFAYAPGGGDIKTSVYATNLTGIFINYYLDLKNKKYIVKTDSTTYINMQISLGSY